MRKAYRSAQSAGREYYAHDAYWRCAASSRQNPPRVRGLNTVGLTRAGFSEDAKRALKNAYRTLFKSAAPLAEVLAELEQVDDQNVAHLVNFIRGSKRGFIRA